MIHKKHASAQTVCNNFGKCGVVWLGLKWGVFTCVGWQVAPGDPE